MIKENPFGTIRIVKKAEEQGDENNKDHMPRPDREVEKISSAADTAAIKNIMSENPGMSFDEAKEKYGEIKAAEEELEASLEQIQEKNNKAAEGKELNKVGIRKL